MKPLKPSGWGIIVDKSNATKSYPMEKYKNNKYAVSKKTCN